MLERRRKAEVLPFITAAHNSFRLLCYNQENIRVPLNGDDHFHSAVNSITRFPYDLSNIILSSTTKDLERIT